MIPRMNNDIDSDTYRQRLLERREQLLAYREQREQDAGTVELDQTRTGRLSRMDALQGQAMAQASQARAEEELRRIAAALRRIDSGDFGFCAACDEPISPGRLDADPSTPLCIDCAEQADAR
jgi:DnaK suppressor protein